MVKTQAQMMRSTSDQRTEFQRLAAPTPMIEVVMVWVVLTGMPK